MTTIKEGFSVETVDGLIFYVKGIFQADDRFYGVLRYYPIESGSRDGFEKISTLNESNSYIRKNYPQYLKYDKHLGCAIQSVPLDKILKSYDPARVLSALKKKKTLDPLEREVVDFSDILVRTSNIPLECVGVAGSVSVGLHITESDIDMVVYGSKPCQSVYAVLPMLNEENFEKYDKTNIAGLYRLRGEPLGFSFEQFVKTEARKRLQGKYAGVDFFIRLVKLGGEFDSKVFSTPFRACGQVRAIATISDDSEGMFTPSIYRLKDVDISKGTVESIDYTLSFRGRFTENARVGERVEIIGVCEKTEDTYVRVVLGNSISDRLTVL